MNESLKNLLTRLKEEEHIKNRLCPFAFKRGICTSIFEDPVCFAALNKAHDSSPITELGMSFFQINRWEKNSETNKRNRKLLRWIINKSPWNKAFKVKGKRLEYYVKNGIDMEVELPAQYVVGAMTALRQVWEFYEFPGLWEFLVKKKVSKELAFIVATNFYKHEVKWECKGFVSNHAVIDSHITKECLKAFKAGEINPKFKDNTLLQNGGYYKGIVDTFSAKGKATVTIKDLFYEKATRKTIQWGYELFMEEKNFIKFLKDFENEE